MLLDATQEGKQLWVSYFNLNGDTRFKTYDLTPDDMFNWVLCDESDKRKDRKIRNWNGQAVRKRKTKFLNKYRIIEYLDNISKSDKKTIYDYNFPKTYFIDIEVEVTEGFPEAKRAPNPITAICIVTPKKQCIVLATKDLSHNQQKRIQNQIDDHFAKIGEDFEFKFKCFNSEYDMLYTFLYKFVRNMPMMTGWNYIKFDWVYIVNRARKIGIDPSISSPIDRLFGKNEFPAHVGVMDYLDIYDKWDRTVDIKEDLKLDTAGEAVVGIKKVKYNGSIQNMYENEYPKYIFYNAIDTALVYLIHQRIKTMEIVLTISHISKISIFKAGSPVAITESLLAREFLSDNKVLGKDYSKDEPKQESFEGAFVKEPKTGMHKAVAAFDFASLYPSIMRQLNISPESFIKRIDPKKALEEKDESKIVSVSGAIFDNRKQSILKTILSDLYGKRRVYKQKYFELKQKAYDMEQELKIQKS